ncbi:hypothetical protein GBA52_006085 [Prunus armeniaca]|nr:hypothetical protein GBA52_006085 [Prunus armeniaca]
MGLPVVFSFLKWRDQGAGNDGAGGAAFIGGIGAVLADHQLQKDQGLKPRGSLLQEPQPEAQVGCPNLEWEQLPDTCA